MNMNVVCRQDLLKRRIEDFFSYRRERQAARALLLSLAEQSHAWIFGGMIRDIGLFGARGFRSDIDVVINSDHQTLLRQLQQAGVRDYQVNKLGGIRFRYQSTDIDIWCLQDTWAFRHKLIPYKDEKSLLQTTLMNWDAVLYGLHNRQLISPANYLDDLLQRRLELVLDHTPNEAGSLVKILRTIYGKQADRLGPKLCRYLQTTLPRYSCTTLMRYELSHYRSSSINGLRLERLQQILQSAAPGSELVSVSGLQWHQSQLPLCFASN